MNVRENRYLTLTKNVDNGTYTIVIKTNNYTETFTDLNEAHEAYDCWCDVYFKERNQ